MAMNIIVCTGVKNVKEWFSPLERSRKYSLTLISPDELQGRIKVTTGHSVPKNGKNSVSRSQKKKICASRL